MWSVYAPSFLLAMGQGLLLPVLPLYARETFGAGDLLVGLAVSARHFGTMGFDVPAGVLIGRFGLNKTMIAGVILFTVSSLFAALSANFTMLILSRFLAGMSFALWSISRHSYIAAVIPNEQRGKALALFGGLSRTATIIGPLLGGILAEFVSIRSPFFIQALISLLTLVLIINTTRNFELTISDKKRKFINEFTYTFSKHKKVYLTTGIAAVALQFLRASREFFIPIWGDNIDLRKDEIGYIVTLSHVVDTIMFPISGYVMDRFGRKFTGIPTYIILGLSLMLMGTVGNPLPYLTSYNTLLLSSLLAGIGNGISSGLVITLGADLSPKKNPASFLGIWRLISDAGGASGPAFIGVLANVFSLGLASLSSGFIAIVGVVFLGFLSKETLIKKKSK